MEDYKKINFLELREIQILRGIRGHPRSLRMIVLLYLEGLRTQEFALLFLCKTAV